MQSIKTELLELENINGRNVYARRLYNEALQGGGLRAFIKRMFGRKKKKTPTYTPTVPTTSNVSVTSMVQSPSPMRSTTLTQTTSSRPYQPYKPYKRSHGKSTTPTQSVSPRRKIRKKKSSTIDWKQAYCMFCRILGEAIPPSADETHKKQMRDANSIKTDRVNATFTPIEAGGEGDCFFYSLLYYNARKLNLELIDNLLHSCHTRHIDNQVKCLRDTFYQLGQTVPIRRNKEEILTRIRTMGQWIQDEDIVVIATVLDIAIYVYSQTEGVWRIFQPFTPSPNCPIMYIINLGTTSTNRLAGYHYQPLIREQDAYFACDKEDTYTTFL